MFRSRAPATCLSDRRTLSTSPPAPASSAPPPPSAPTPAPRPSFVRRLTPPLLVGISTGYFVHKVYSEEEFRTSVEQAFPPSAKLFSQLFDLLPESLAPPSLRSNPVPKETAARVSDDKKKSSDIAAHPPTYDSINTERREVGASAKESPSTLEQKIDHSLSKEEPANLAGEPKDLELQASESSVKEKPAITDGKAKSSIPAIELPKVSTLKKETTSIPQTLHLPVIENEESSMGSEKDVGSNKKDAPVRSAKGKLARLLGKGDFEAAKVIGPDLVDDSEYMKPNLGSAPSISIFDSIPSTPELPVAGSTKALTTKTGPEEHSVISEQHVNEVEALRSEIRSQLKWEAVRLQEAVRSQMVEDKKIAAKEVSVITKKHSEELAKVREDAMTQAERILIERTRKIREEAEKQRDEELNKMLAEKEAELRHTLATEYAELRRNETEGRELALMAAEANVSAMSDRFNALVEQTEKAKDAARRASSAFMLHENIASCQPFGKLLQDASGSELGELVSASVPSSAMSHGVLSIDSLKQDFKRASKRGLSAALVPENKQGTIWGHLLGSIFSRLKIPVDIRLASEEPPKTNEDRIRLAKNLLDDGNLGGAVATLGALDGLPKELMSDWVSDAKARIAAEQAAEVLLADAIIAQISLTKGEGINIIST
ncbi:inner membrane protein [Gracilaria domingensis]|nr:inner membrane protein [Gracilaria domingensis]